MAPSDSALQATLERMSNLTEKIVAQFQRLTDHLNSGWLILPEFIWNQIVKLFNEAMKAVQRVWEELQKYLANPGNPGSLSQVGGWWAADVQGPSSGLAGYFNESASQIDDYWEGDAARAYLRTLEPQKRMLWQFGATAGAIGVALEACSQIILQFWLRIGGAYVLWAGAVSAAIATAVASAGLGIVFALEAIGGACGLFLVAILKGAADARKDLGNEMAKIRKELNENNNLQAGKWPRSTLNLLDGTPAPTN